jgi:hypothetical protein
MVSSVGLNTQLDNKQPLVRHMSKGLKAAAVANPSWSSVAGHIGLPETFAGGTISDTICLKLLTLSRSLQCWLWCT